MFMNEKKDGLRPGSTPATKCSMCGKKLRYAFEIQSGICESCQIGKQAKVSKNVKRFEEFNSEQNNENTI
jgi:hypothetical protein